ncbi:hypothetical protein [Micromonospora tulbaghiae]|uniref:hypothetical protein n=1 Tax=Micromonospora tulbaghiae TaxID=479978 RepID=UPI0033C8524E
MSAATLPHPQGTVTGNPGNVDHYYCCDDETALCGADLAGVPDGPEFDEVCPLCVLVMEEGAPCPGCGE